MISKLCASWLVVLVLLPFTAPFSTCDLARSVRDTGTGLPFRPRLAAAAATDTDAALVPARAMMSRHKLIARVGHLERREPASAVNVAPFADSHTSIQRHEARHTILRL
jgi:hypothetical protein